MNFCISANQLIWKDAWLSTLDTSPLSRWIFSEAACVDIPHRWNLQVDIVEVVEEMINTGNQAKVNYWITNEETCLIQMHSSEFNVQFNS